MYPFKEEIDLKSSCGAGSSGSSLSSGLKQA